MPAAASAGPSTFALAAPRPQPLLACQRRASAHKSLCLSKGSSQPGAHRVRIHLGPLPRRRLILWQAVEVLPCHHRVLRVVRLRRGQQRLRGRGRKHAEKRGGGSDDQHMPSCGGACPATPVGQSRSQVPAVAVRATTLQAQGAGCRLMHAPTCWTGCMPSCAPPARPSRRCQHARPAAVGTPALLLPHLQRQQRRLERQRRAPLVFQDVQADGAVGGADVGVPHLHHGGEGLGVLSSQSRGFRRALHPARGRRQSACRKVALGSGPGSPPRPTTPPSRRAAPAAA